MNNERSFILHPADVTHTFLAVATDGESRKFKFRILLSGYYFDHSNEPLHDNVLSMINISRENVALNLRPSPGDLLNYELSREMHPNPELVKRVRKIIDYERWIFPDREPWDRKKVERWQDRRRQPAIKRTF